MAGSTAPFLSTRAFIMAIVRCLVAALALSPLFLATAADPPKHVAKEAKFKKIQLDDKFHSEGVAVGDFNHDGKMDIAAGNVYYAAPDWHMVVIDPDPKTGEAKTYDPNGYSNSFCNFAADLNGDGWTDLIVVDFPGQKTWWYENPGRAGGPWKKHVITEVTNNESPTFSLLVNPRKRSLVCGINPDPKNPDGPERRMAFLDPAKDPYEPWTIRTVSKKAPPGTNKYSHGLGVGDVNRDGRNDILCKDGWWEAPADESQAEWVFHPANFGPDCAQMYSVDINGDAKNDVLTSSAHNKGIWWHEQTADGWKSHLIDDTISQTHSMCITDINGDGLFDIVTGKRWWAHGPKGDVDPDKPAVLVWYQSQRNKDGTVDWIKHVIDEDSGVGTQFEMAHINGDDRVDIAVSNKKGVFIFLQEH